MTKIDIWATWAKTLRVGKLKSRSSISLAFRACLTLEPAPLFFRVICVWVSEYSFTSMLTNSSSPGFGMGPFWLLRPNTDIGSDMRGDFPRWVRPDSLEEIRLSFTFPFGRFFVVPFSSPLSAALLVCGWGWVCLKGRMRYDRLICRVLLLWISDWGMGFRCWLKIGFFIGKERTKDVGLLLQVGTSLARLLFW